ncbi:MAG: cohesin domain-containing protein [Caldilineaceae bacterium]
MKHSTLWGLLRALVIISLLILPSAPALFAAAELAPLAQATSTISFPNASSDPGQSGSFSISLDNPVEVASGQLRFTYSATIGLQITNLQTTARTAGYTIATSNVANPNPALREIQVLFYTLNQGTSIITGTGAILTVNYTTALTATGSTALNFTQTLLASPSATSLPVTAVNGSFTINSVATNTPTNTATNTPVPPTNTPTNTATNTAVPPTNTPTNTATNTPVPPTNTPTNTATNAAVPPAPMHRRIRPRIRQYHRPTRQPTLQPISPVAPTNTPTNTATNTAVAPTNTPTNTATNTPVAPTNTPTNTATNTAVTPTNTDKHSNQHSGRAN